MRATIIRCNLSRKTSRFYRGALHQIVRIIMALAQALKLDVVAEGVETRGQAEFLRSCGCSTAQGYLYSRPQPAAAFESWLGEYVARPGQHHGVASDTADRLPRLAISNL